MSSFIRRLERQLVPSRKVHPELDSKGKWTGKFYANPARQKFYGKHIWSSGRGSRLGVSNPKCKALLARTKREERRAGDAS